MTAPPLLLDITRLVVHAFSKKHATGIERVCAAYLAHFADRSLAVLQYRGLFRVLRKADGEALMSVLQRADSVPRRTLLRALLAGLSRSSPNPPFRGLRYVNIGHTDFDLPGHLEWIERNQVQPLYFIHDLIPLTHPHFTTPHKAKRHRGRVENALRYGVGMIVNSEATKDELMRYAQLHRLPLPPLRVARLASSQNRRCTQGSADPRPKFLCIGTIEPRKNHILLLRIWCKLIGRMGDDAPDLCIIGKWGVLAQPVRDFLAANPSLAQHVSLRHDCSDEERAKMMTTARGLLFPSLAEGFGLPVMEALQNGLPVIASDLPCLREIGEGGPEFCDPSDEDAWLRAIEDFANCGPRFRRQISKLGHFRAPTWQSHFAGLDEWIACLHQANHDEGLASKSTIADGLSLSLATG